MTNTDGSLRIRVPYSRARRYVREALQGGSDGRLPKILRLTAHVRRAPMAYGAAPSESWKIQWDPEPRSIYPPFQGELTIGRSVTDESTCLSLECWYARPRGVAGLLFDASVEPKIAAATAQNLLQEIAAEFEGRYKRERILQLDGAAT